MSLVSLIGSKNLLDQARGLMPCIAVVEQQVGQVGTVLTGYAGDEGDFLFLGHDWPDLILAKRSGTDGGASAPELGFEVGRGRRDSKALRTTRKKA